MDYETLIRKYESMRDGVPELSEFYSGAIAGAKETMKILKMKEDKPMNIYLAGSIFYYGDVLRNTEWAKKIRDAIPNVNLYSPIENTEINGEEGKKKCASSNMIADGDNQRLDNTDFLIACIDGDVLPSGTCAEIGKFHEKIARGDHKYIVGIMTDNRSGHKTYSDPKAEALKTIGENQFCYQNLYVTGLIKQGGILVDNIEDAISFIKSKEGEFNA